MLNKVKVGAIVAAIIMVLRLFIPDLEIPEKLEESIMLLIIFITQFFVKESPTSVAKLDVPIAATIKKLEEKKAEEKK